MKKIDMHCHTTNRPVENIIPVSASLQEIEKQMKEYDIEKTVLLATYFPHRGTGVSNFRLASWIRDNPKFVMFGSLDFEYYFHQGFNELEELSESGLIKGIKLYTCYQNIDLKSDNLHELVNLAKRKSLPMMFHCGYSYSSKRKYGKPAITEMVGPKDLEFLAQNNPEVNFVFSHLGKPFFSEMAEVINRNPNVYTDMSGLIDSKFNRDEIPFDINEISGLLHKCGTERLLFGTDFPVQTHKDSVYFVEEAMKNFSDKDKENVYYNNIRRLLK